LSALLNTHEFEIFVKEKYEALKVFAQNDNIYCELDIYFSNGKGRMRTQIKEGIITLLLKEEKLLYIK